MTSSIDQLQLLTGGNIVTRVTSPRPVRPGARKVILIHLLASIALMAVGVLGFWICSPVWNTAAAFFSSGMITLACNVIIGITWFNQR